MFQLKPKDIIALVALLGLIALKILGIDGNVDVAIALILGYYFGHRHTKIDNGK